MREICIRKSDFSYMSVQGGIIHMPFDQDRMDVMHLLVSDDLHDSEMKDISPYPCVCDAPQAQRLRGIVGSLPKGSEIIELNAAFGGHALLAKDIIPKDSTWHLIEPMWNSQVDMQALMSSYIGPAHVETIEINHNITGFADLRHYVADRLTSVACLRTWPHTPTSLTFWQQPIDLLLCSPSLLGSDAFEDAVRYFSLLKPGARAIGLNYHSFDQCRRLANRLAGATKRDLQITDGMWSITA